MAGVNAPGRIALLDEIRGVCIYLMVYYHAFYLLGAQLHLDFCARLFRFFEPIETFHGIKPPFLS